MATHARYVTFRMAVAELTEQDAPDEKVQELQGKLEESTSEKERRKLEHRELERSLLQAWNTNNDLLNKMVSWLDERAKGQKQ